MPRAEKLYVLVVDDSRLMRRLIGDILTEMETVGRVAFAADASAARVLLAGDRPDVVTLDIEMPDISGIALLEQIMARDPLPVVMVSALTSQGAEATLSALEKGAVEAIGKPTGLDAMLSFRVELARAVTFAGSAKVARPNPMQNVPKRARYKILSEPELIGIAASTGGVAALATILPALAYDCPPVVITQHMPAPFLARLASRLRERLGRDIAIAQQGERLSRGMIRFAPGHRHLIPANYGDEMICTLSDLPPRLGHVPSADHMFVGMAGLHRNVLGVILTGMGRDGAEGLRQMRAGGAITIGQDRETCVVYGMPRAAFEIGALQEILPISEIATRLSTFWKPSSAKVAGS